MPPKPFVPGDLALLTVTVDDTRYGTRGGIEPSQRASRDRPAPGRLAPAAPRPAGRRRAAPDPQPPRPRRSRTVARRRFEPGGGREPLLGLVDHRGAAVRADALARLERLAPDGALAAVSSSLEVETDPAVRGAAGRAFCALVESEAVERAASWLDDPATEVRRGALVGLLRYGGIAGVLAAGERLTALVRSASRPSAPWSPR